MSVKEWLKSWSAGWALRVERLSLNAILLLCAAALLMSTTAKIKMRTTVVQLGYQLSRLQQEEMSLSSELSALKTELAARRAPEKLLREGRARYGLDFPKSEQVIVVKEGLTQ